MGTVPVTAFSSLWGTSSEDTGKSSLHQVKESEGGGERE